MKRIDSVAILGSGAMGGLYASYFNKSDLTLYCIARGGRGKRLQRDGLCVNGEHIPLNVLDPANKAGATTVDLVIIAVKHHQLQTALDDLAPFVDDNTTFLSVLNGLDSEEVIGARFGIQHVLYCIALGMDARRQDNQIVFENSGRLVFGEADNSRPSERVRCAQAALDRAGLSWETPTNMLHELWWKFMMNVGVNQASAVMGATFGDFQNSEHARALMDTLTNEVIEISKHSGVNLGKEDMRRWHQVLANLAPQGKTSMLQDVEAGRLTEVDIFAGRVIAMGRRFNVPTPYNDAVYRILNVLSERQLNQG